MLSSGVFQLQSVSYCFGSLWHTCISVCDLLLKKTFWDAYIILHESFPTLWCLLQSAYSLFEKSLLFPFCLSFSVVWVFWVFFNIVYSTSNSTHEMVFHSSSVQFLVCYSEHSSESSINTIDLAHFYVLFFVGTVWFKAFLSSWKLTLEEFMNSIECVLQKLQNHSGLKSVYCYLLLILE